MKKLKYVKKLDQHGCSLACIAMIIGKSYFEIRDAVHRCVPRFKDTWSTPQMMGLYGPEIIDVLKSEFEILGKFIKFVSFKMLKKHCILFICPLDGNRSSGYGGHGIVFDAKTRCILDPDNKTLDLKEYNVFCCIEIQ